MAAWGGMEVCFTYRDELPYSSNDIEFNHAFLYLHPSTSTLICIYSNRF